MYASRSAPCETPPCTLVPPSPAPGRTRGRGRGRDLIGWFMGATGARRREAQSCHEHMKLKTREAWSYKTAAYLM